MWSLLHVSRLSCLDYENKGHCLKKKNKERKRKKDWYNWQSVFCDLSILDEEITLEKLLKSYQKTHSIFILAGERKVIYIQII